MLREGFLEHFIVRYDSDNPVFYKEWFFGTENVERPQLFHESESRFALISGRVCYLARDPQKINFGLGNGSCKKNKHVDFSSQLLPEILGQIPLREWPDFSKLMLNSSIKLFDLSTEQKINALDSLLSQRLQQEVCFIRRLIEGVNEVYKASIDLSEAIKHCGFDGILYKSKTQTDALGPFNDPMIVVYEPSDGRILFQDVVLARSSN